MPALPTDRGSYCRFCGGLTITDAILAWRTVKKGGTQMLRAEAEAIRAALGNGAETTCRRCGADTLAGALLRLEARRERSGPSG